jgi:uncharacterized protein (DUF2249 family)
VERDDDPIPNHILIYQAPDHLKEGVNLLLISDDETTALAHRCFFKETTDV